jgi:ATP-dependent RNA helicase SUPV3L1/SUV3
MQDIFVTLSTLDNDKYFMCNVDDFKFLADMIEHVPLALRARYVFCCAPIPKRQPFVCTMFLKVRMRENLVVEGETRKG